MFLILTTIYFIEFILSLRNTKLIISFLLNYIDSGNVKKIIQQFHMFQRKTDTSPATGNVSNVTNESPTRI